MSGIWLPIGALLISLLLVFLYFSKKHIQTEENNLYYRMIILNFIFSLFGVIIYFCAMKIGSVVLVGLLQKVYLTLLNCITIFMVLYCININEFNKIKYEKYKMILKLFMFFSSVLIIGLPTNTIILNETVDVTGPSYYVVLSSIVISLIIMSAMCIHYVFVLKKELTKCVPFLVLLLLSVGGLLLRKYYPEIITETFFFAFFFLVMYHTIENPDVKMLEEVTIAKETAERANRAKTEFLSSMSHEIRTPLNAIVGFSECILESHDMKKVKNDAKDIIMASQNLLEIVNGILDISKIEADKMEINSSEYSLVDNMNNIAKLMIPRIGEKPILLKTKFAKDIPDVLYGDIGKIKQIVTNLLTNAVKYTDKGLINFEINCLNKGSVCTLVISVEDTGRGIKPEKIDSIFNKFERLEEDRNTTLEGTGLGLAITKTMAQMMGGKVVVQSKYGSGSKFTVYLKQKIVHKPAILKEEIFNSNEKFDCSGKRVLVVDDNNINLKVAVRLLEPFKMYITTCQSGQECIDMANRELFDLILLDDMMPGLTGKETLVKLQENPNFNVPVVALTANAIEGMKEEYLKLGFNDYLAKPIDKLELERVLRKILGDSKDVLKNTFEPLPEELFDMDEPLR